MLFVKNERNKKDLFKRILTGDSNTLGQRSWETFIPNFSIGVIVIVLVTLVVLYIVLP
jgi:hypothetical protein